MIHFVGAGPGAPDLITVRGKKLLEEADLIIYAGSLVNKELLTNAKEGCIVKDSASMTLEEVLKAMEESEAKGVVTVRLHTGDPCLYGAIREQMDALDEKGIDYDYTPGVSSFSAAAAALRAEYTLPGISQSVIITRTAGRTPVPDKQTIVDYAQHGTTMVVFLSTGLVEKLAIQLVEGGYTAQTPAAVVYKASWPEERVYRCTVGTLAETVHTHHLKNTALILVGPFLSSAYERSKLYDPEFTHGFRKGNKE